MTTLIQLHSKQPAVTNPEIDLLVCCARSCIAPETAERIKTLLQQDIDWTYLIQTAVRHRVMPLLYRSLNTICPEAVPKNMLAQLRHFFQTNALRNLFLTQELHRLLNLFIEHDIRAIPFKGPVLAVLAYGNLALREFGDLDILVQEPDLLKVIDLLICEGYQPIDPFWFTTKAQEKAYIYSKGEYPLMNNQGNVCVDLHSRLVSGHLFNLSANFDSFWENLEPVLLNTNTVSSFRPEDLLLYLCLHGAKSFWGKLANICDISELVSTHQALDWEQLIAQTKALGCERILLLGCFLATDLLGTNLPKEIYKRIDADSQIPSLAKQVYQRVKGQTEYPPDGEYTLNCFIFHFGVMERTEDKFQYSLKCLVACGLFPWRILFRLSRKDRDFLTLPHNLYFLYYLLRPIRLVSKLFLLIWQRIITVF